MGQIVKRKKGRPAKGKADPDARDLPAAERDVRRSLRRRSVKYVFDLDDYFDEDEVFVDHEDQRRREKKLKLLLKLQSSVEQESTAPRDRRVPHGSAASASSSDDGGKPSKKRKIDDEMNEEVDEENDYADEEENCNNEDEEEVRETKRELKPEDSPPGTPGEAQCGLRLPDNKVLELILDKLQRKDIYGVYAEPVDPEELPDYHDVIDHPMDFATVRNNLRNGSYATFEQFESDVFLICSNAMQYNAPDTIYHKQARTIQELAKRKFHKVRLNFERNGKEIKPEQKAKSSSLSKKQIKRPLSRTVQEPVGSDFSSGATLATVGDIQNVAVALQADGLVDGSSFLNDSSLEKVDDSLPGRGTMSRFGRRSPFVQDENRRATYNVSLSQSMAISESIFSTFDDETKQLMPVGLYSDHSYARSLAQFAATLGSIAWKVASKRIEQVLPQGFKFGQGWVGEYEPLPTPVLMLKNCSLKEPPFFMKAQPAVKKQNFERVPINFETSKESPGNLHFSEQKLPFLGSAGIGSSACQLIRGSSLSETRPPLFLSSGVRPSARHNLSHTNQNLQSSRDLIESDKKVHKQVELNKVAADSIGIGQFSRSSEVEASRLMEFSPKNMNFSQLQLDHNSGVAFGRLPNGKAVGNKVDGNITPNLIKPITYYPCEQGQGQGLSDPFQLMRMLADRNQQKPSNQSSPQFLTSNYPNSAAMDAARVWMSVGAGGLRPVGENANPDKNSRHGDPRDIQSQTRTIGTGEFPSGLHKNGAAVHAFVPQGPMQMPMLVGNQMVFPQLATTDLSRFQMQSMHSRQRQESLPPDLNIRFQSSGSPASGVLVDSQQPDLALQL